MRKVISDRVWLRKGFEMLNGNKKTETSTRCRSWKTDSGKVVNRNEQKQQRSKVKIALLQVSQKKVKQCLIESDWEKVLKCWMETKNRNKKHKVGSWEMKDKETGNSK